MTPLTLAIDTSTDTTVLLIAEAGRLLLDLAIPDDRRRGAGLIVAICDLVGRAGLSLGDFGLFAAGLGPGSYTGLRVGMTAMKTFAYVFNKPLVGLDSLWALAAGAPPDAVSFWVAIDAQRGRRMPGGFVVSQPAGSSTIQRNRLCPGRS